MGKGLRSDIGVRRLIRFGRYLSEVFAILIVLLSLPWPARAEANSVTLASFEAIGLNGEVDLVWVTATELNNSGFYVNRSSSLTGFRDRIPIIIPGVVELLPFVPSTSDGLPNTFYEVYDRNVVNGATYYYWVESVSNSGTSTFSPPQSATTLTDTTATVTSTPTPTPTSTGNATAIATPTRTRAPTLTAIFTPNNNFQATSTPVPQNTWTPLPVTPGTVAPTDTTTPTSTPTLAPLPSITLLFPLVTDIGVPTPTSTVNPPQSGSVFSSPSGNSGISSGILLLIVLIVVIWILLGAFLFFYIRRIGIES